MKNIKKRKKWKSELFGYHIKDSRKLDEVVKKPIVDVVVTSPPYWNLKDYDRENQIGFKQDYETYLKDLILVLKKCSDVLKKSGSIWIVVDSFKKGNNIKLLPFDLANRLQKNGLYLQDIIIWQKNKTLPWSRKGKLRNIFEYILFFTKDKKRFKYYVDRLREIDLKKWWIKYPERYNPKGKVPSRVWDISIPMQGWGKTWVRHFNPFPPELVERILFLVTNSQDVVLDPFAGSGSVLAQAHVMKRKIIGFDLNKDYRKMYRGTVMPFFESTWKHRKKQLNLLTKKRRHLKKTIIKLRQLKYPILLLEALKENRGKGIVKNIKCIVVIGNDSELDVKYCFILQHAQNNERIITKLYETAQAKKLKKFSLRCTFIIEDISGLKSKITSSKFLYTYKFPHTHYFQKRIKSCKLKHLFSQKNKQLILLSNLKVNEKTRGKQL